MRASIRALAPTALGSSPLHHSSDELAGAGVVDGIEGGVRCLGKVEHRSRDPGQQDDALLVGHRRDRIDHLQRRRNAQQAGERYACLRLAQPPERTGSRCAHVGI